jgi:hypothetical protein
MIRWCEHNRTSDDGRRRQRRRRPCPMADRAGGVAGSGRRTAGRSPSMPATSARTGCSTCLPGRCGMKMRSAMMCAPTWSIQPVADAAPRLLAVDLDGAAAGVPLLLMTALAGSSTIPPSRPRSGCGRWGPPRPRSTPWRPRHVPACRCGCGPWPMLVHGDLWQATGHHPGHDGVLGPGGGADHPDRHGAVAAGGPRPWSPRPGRRDPDGSPRRAPAGGA